MSYLDATILGIIEGFTEFLPISSTGHLILASSVLGLPQTDFLKSFEIIIQLGAILAVVVLYFKKIFSNFDLIKKAIIAFIPTAIIGLMLYKIVKNYLLGNEMVVIGSLLVGGIIILFFSRWEEKNADNVEVSDFSDISYKKAFYVGLCQAVSIIPGVSRSAATIIGGRLIGIRRKSIVEFSFILAIPTMLAASSLDIIKSFDVFSFDNIGLLGLGFAVSFVVALVIIEAFIKYVERHNFSIFGWYRIALSVIAYFVLFG